ncbi:MAG: hypothetical protein HETSPECPRED_000928 [Heterodermia speciosa]|uniref:Signal peptide peptidase n=1 Tax=Heterodermia speciosa TaxID=116794 RepID=A0A8H3IDX9_9LECA|nr:MAG: hypothetical protein HETSPECPRED_000928 [Heterodermia speciosa]
MESIRQVLDEIADQWTLVRPTLGTEVHILLAALFTIYTGSHASLTRPTSAGKPAKRKKQPGEHEEDAPSESLQKMEALSPSDAIMFPLMAGLTLGVLYIIIQWLEDPAILNTALNWYFAVFGLLGITKLFVDAMDLAQSLVFPSKYAYSGQIWEIKPKQRFAVATKSKQKKCSSPLPGLLSRLSLPPKVASAIWTIRELLSKKVHVRIYIHRMLGMNLHIGPQGFLSFLMALVATLFFNLVAKPWWLMNILGYSFAYTSLQLLSPTTFSTGTLMLAGLFVYDIYFVFFTPLMVTVATKLDIPAKMLFPRPSSSNENPPRRSFAMLGLGDIVLPGLVIGFALRFDLYLYYLRKQKPQNQENIKNEGSGSMKELGMTDTRENKVTETTKAEYKTATGGWGERFWVGKHDSAGEPINGGVFPKTYFYACILGYVAGMVTTLGVMSISGSAQPALLYLVPGVLISLWTTALFKGDLNEMWRFDETDPEEKSSKNSDEPKKPLKSIFSRSRQDEMGERLEGFLNGDADKDATLAERKKSKTKEQVDVDSSNEKGSFFRDRKTELAFFSINFPGYSSLPEEAGSESPTMTGHQISKPKQNVEDELRAAFEGNLADTPPSTRTRSMRKSILNREDSATETRPEKRLKRTS